MTKYESLPRDEDGAIRAREVAFPVLVPLASPFESGGRTVSELSVREPTVADIELANKESTGLARMLRMLSLVADTAPDDLRKLGSRDYVLLQDLLELFL